MKTKSLLTVTGLTVLSGMLFLMGQTARAQSVPDAVWAMAGHQSTVTAVAFSPDGSHLVSGSFDRTLKVWRASDGALVRTMNCVADVKAVAFSPDGSLVAAGCYDRCVHLWRVSDGALVGSLQGHADVVRSVAFSPDGSLLASGSQDRTVNVWRVSDGVLVRSLAGNANWVMSVAFSPDGGTVVSGGADRTVTFWRVVDGQIIRRLSGHADWVMSVAFSPNGAQLASAGMDFSVKVWNVADGSLARNQTGFADAVNWVAFSADGGSLITADWSVAIKVFQTSDGSLSRSFGEGSLVGSVQFSPDGTSFAYGRADGAVVLARNSGGTVTPPVVSVLDALASTDKPSYSNREKARIFISVTDGINPVVGANVSTTVTSSKGTKTVLSGMTGANGLAAFTYSVNTRQGTGTYKLDASAAKSGFKSATDSTTFTVTR